MSNARTRFGLGALMAALALLIGPAIAGATTVNPAGGPVDLSLKPGTTADFVTDNGTGALLQCTTSNGTGNVPAVPYNAAPGSVFGKVVTLSWGGCTALGGFVNVTVNVNDPEEWSTSALWAPHQTNEPDPVNDIQDWDAVVGINAPPESVVINIHISGGCELTVGLNGSGSDRRAFSVLGHWNNDDRNGNATLWVNNSQVPFAQTDGACFGVNTNSPAQYHAVYQETNGVTITR